MDKILQTAQFFNIKGVPSEYTVCHAGHINDTYIVSTNDNGKEHKYVLQRINTYVFKNPDQLMSNIIGVTTYLRRVLLEGGMDAERGTLNFEKTKDGKSYFKDDNGDCYRLYRYVDNAISYNLADSEEIFRKSGYTFGRFQLQLASYDASKLYETIPDFHNTAKRFDRFVTVVAECKSERKNTAADEIKFILDRKDKCSLIVNEIRDGKIPLRVTHNDTKLNNILIDEKTGDGVCVIDLDTIMPGSSLYDFGDSIRFGASSALEDEKDLDKVYFRNNMFEAYTRGYIEGAGGKLTEHEIRMMPMGAYILTLETGMRFLTDYLENDVYFKTAYSDHNLVRAKNQLKLVYDIETRMNEFDAIINSIIGE